MTAATLHCAAPDCGRPFVSARFAARARYCGTTCRCRHFQQRRRGTVLRQSKAARARALRRANPSVSVAAIALQLGMRASHVRKAWDAKLSHAERVA